MAEFEFNVKRKQPDPSIRVPLRVEEAEEIKELAIQEGTTMPQAALVLLRAGLEEYHKWLAKQ